MKKNSILILIIFLVFSLTSACNRQQKSNEKESVAHSANEQANAPFNQSAEKMYEKLLASFGADWMEREADPNLYPDYFAGAFINNNGRFVVAVTGNMEENKKRLEKILETDQFSVETVQYSYKQMMLVMDSIDDFLVNSSIPEDHPLISCFAGAYPDVMENRVKVILTKVDNTTTGLFRKDVVNSPLIVFEQGDLPQLQ